MYPTDGSSFPITPDFSPFCKSRRRSALENILYLARFSQAQKLPFYILKTEVARTNFAVSFSRGFSYEE